MNSTGNDKQVILFNGELQAGFSREFSLKQLSVLTNLSHDELLELLFSIKPVIVNEVQGTALAETYRSALEEAGLQVQVESASEHHAEIINVELEFGHYAPRERTESGPNYTIDTDHLELLATPTDPPVSSADNPRYAVIFYGYLDPGYTKAEIIENIRHLTKASEQRIIEELFSVVPVVIKRSTDKKIAEEYLNAFQRAGMEVDLDEDFSNPDASESRLMLRDDKPAMLPPNRPRTFTYCLLAIAVLAMAGWLIVFSTMDGFFRQPQELIIELQIQAPQPETLAAAPEAREIAPEPRAEPPPELQQEPANIPAPAPASEQKQDQSPPDAAEFQPRIRSSSETETAEKNYYMSLLSWFAHPRHQQYGSETRKLNLEGEIELQITIHRDGTLKDVTVAASSSPKLTAITTATARRASPYPPVPESISGSEYRFRLPLKYTLEDNP